MENKLYLALDFEATCDNSGPDGNNPEGYQTEIIEAPFELYDNEFNPISHKQFYIRPKLNPILSEFCKNLTGITQEQVDNGLEFKDAIRKVGVWLLSTLELVKYTNPLYSGIKTPKIIPITFGDWDIQVCLAQQLAILGIKDFPWFLKKWINVKTEFRVFAGDKLGKEKFNLIDALEYFGLEFEGHLHCGLDDARNTARLLKAMIANGYDIENANIRYIFMG